jgi:hypothetical protein
MAEIYTTLGMMDEALLVRTEGVDEDERARAEWREWRHAGEIVKREVNITVKQSHVIGAVAGSVG